MPAPDRPDDRLPAGPVPSAGPPDPRRAGRCAAGRRMFWTVFAGTVVLLAAVLGTAFGTGGFGTTSGRPTAAPPTSQITGTPDDWAAAVCRDGTVITSQWSKFERTGPVEMSNCAARADNPGLAPPGLMFGRWPTADLGGLLKTAPSMQFTGVAVAPVDGGVFVFTSQNDLTGTALAPLGRFGFTITAISRPR